jgi:hypothetical protein
MKKAIITITITREVSLDPSIYDRDMTDEEMLADEIRFAEDLPHEFMDLDDVVWKTTGELIDK